MGQEKKDKVNCELQEKQKARREQEGHPLWSGSDKHLCDLD